MKSRLVKIDFLICPLTVPQKGSTPLYHKYVTCHLVEVEWKWFLHEKSEMWKVYDDGRRPCAMILVYWTTDGLITNSIYMYNKQNEDPDTFLSFCKFGNHIFAVFEEIPSLSEYIVYYTWMELHWTQSFCRHCSQRSLHTGILSCVKTNYIK